jgi:hypothetical protein
MEFTGKVALITGGGGGIGRASALGFAQRHSSVLFVCGPVNVTYMMVADEDPALFGGPNSSIPSAVSNAPIIHQCGCSTAPKRLAWSSSRIFRGSRARPAADRRLPRSRPLFQQQSDRSDHANHYRDHVP